VKANHARNHIYQLITEEGKAVTDINTINELAPAFYKQLFYQDSYWNIFPQVVVKRNLTVEASTWLSRDVTNLEVKEAMFQMHPDKAPGPDGYNAYFFQRNWDMIGGDICKVFHSFFQIWKTSH